MPLETKIRELFAKNKNLHILVVDDRCGMSVPCDNVDNDRIFHEQACQDLAKENGIDLFFSESTHDFVQNGPGRSTDYANYDLILVRTPCQSIVPNILGAMQSVDLIKSSSPETEVYLILPELDGPANRAIDQVSSLFMSHDQVDGIEKVNFEDFPTTMHHLHNLLSGNTFGVPNHRLSSFQHRHKNEMWDQYLPFIGQSLKAGNSQTGIDFHFLILSDRDHYLLGDNEVNAREKVKVRKLDYQLEKEDFEKCACIFVDNTWKDKIFPGAIGKGIEKLKEIREQLDQKGISLPIVYQSGHNLEDFTQEEKSQIESLGAVLAAKNIFPKVCQKSLSEKELAMGQILKSYPVLSQYTSQIYDFGKNLGDGNLFVVCSKIVDQEKEKDSEKQKLFHQLKLEDNAQNHKMYVLSLFHTELKSEISNPKLQATGRDFYSFDEIVSKLPQDLAEQIEPLRERYQAIIEKHRTYQPTIITHNDAKWDNWFKNQVLGDFGSVQPGTEYKDIAKSLLDKEDGFALALDKQAVEQAVDVYLTLRKELDPSFKPDQSFKENVKEMLITESLRTIFYKSGQKDLVEGLMKIVEAYK